MRKRKVYLVVELDAADLAGLPAHLAAIVTRPEVQPIQTREAPHGPWFPTEEQRREKRTQARLARVHAKQAEAIARGDISSPESEG